MPLKPTAQEEDLLKQHEWDFSGCSEEERRFCCYYEYLRSSEPVRAIFERYGRTTIKELLKDGVHVVGLFDANIIIPPEEQRIVKIDGQEDLFKPLLVALATIQDFPKKPWLDLPPETRKQLIQDYTEFVRIYPDISSTQLMELSEQRRTRSLLWPESFWVLRIPFGMSRKEIIEALTGELKTFEASHPENFRPLKGKRGSYSDKLNQLGAWRLLNVIDDAHHACSYTMKRLKQEPHKKPRGLYLDKYEFQLAAKKASSLLKSFIIFGK